MADNQQLTETSTSPFKQERVRKTQQRRRRAEATTDEIHATADAIETEESATHYPNPKASDIPPAALLVGEKHEYDPHQLRVLIHPQGSTVALSTEAAHADRAIRYYGNDIAECPELGFLYYSEKTGVWDQDDKESTLTHAKLKALSPEVRNEAAAMFRYSATLTTARRDNDARAMSRAANAHLLHAQQIERRAFLIGAARFVAASCRTKVELFSPRPWRFAFSNCVFDRGKFRPARRDDYLLYVSPVVLDKRADRREWCALLNRITKGDEDFARTLQDVCAYACSGAASLRVIPWFYGPSGTGKSTICELLQTLLGRFAVTVDPTLLTDRAQREKLGAVIWAKLAAFLPEAGNQRISAELLKTLSGGDRISVGFKYKESFTAQPTHALFLAANDPPKTDAYDEALKVRVLALPFDHPLAEGEPLKFEGHTRLESARTDPNSFLLRGFAAWVADGLENLYQAQEIYRGQTVKKATAQFWADTDELTPFWETISQEKLRLGIPKGDLRKAYEEWCSIERLRPLNQRDWKKACEEGKGLMESKTGDIRKWKIGTTGTTSSLFLQNPFTQDSPTEELLKTASQVVPVVPDKEADVI